MSDKSKDIRGLLTVIQGGKQDTVIQDGKKDYASAPQLCSEFDACGFLSQGDTLDYSNLELTPAKHPILLYWDENNQPVLGY